MFTKEEREELVESIKLCVKQDGGLLEDLLEDVKHIGQGVRIIRPRSLNSISLVASDGSSTKLQFDPFSVQLIRVVDSSGERLISSAISSLFDIAILNKQQFKENSTTEPITSLGRMMVDLGIETGEISDLSASIPSIEEQRNPRKPPSGDWVTYYRDLCEWAALYDLICHRDFGADVLVIRDGLLRSNLFKGDKFTELVNRMEEAIEKNLKRRHRNIYLVGFTKRSKVLSRYDLALRLQEVFPKGSSCYAGIPPEIESKVSLWQQYGATIQNQTERSKGWLTDQYVAGKMFFAKFGGRSGDPIWPIDIAKFQTHKADEIFSYLLADAELGFPVPYYPRCLQKAHEHASIVDFDHDIIQHSIFNAVRDSLLNEKQKNIVEGIMIRNEAKPWRRT